MNDVITFNCFSKTFIKLICSIPAKSCLYAQLKNVVSSLLLLPAYDEIRFLRVDFSRGTYQVNVLKDGIEYAYRFAKSGELTARNCGWHFTEDEYVTDKKRRHACLENEMKIIDKFIRMEDDHE